MSSLDKYLLLYESFYDCPVPKDLSLAFDSIRSKTPIPQSIRDYYGLLGNWRDVYRDLALYHPGDLKVKKGAFVPFIWDCHGGGEGAFHIDDASQDDPVIYWDFYDEVGSQPEKWESTCSEILKDMILAAYGGYPFGGSVNTPLNKLEPILKTEWTTLHDLGSAIYYKHSGNLIALDLQFGRGATYACRTDADLTNLAKDFDLIPFPKVVWTGAP